MERWVILSSSKLCDLRCIPTTTIWEAGRGTPL